jgi:hypothetical protein
MTDDDATHTHSHSGAQNTDSQIEALAAEAEAGYDVDRLIARRCQHGRPALGSSPASVESVRLDPSCCNVLDQTDDALGGHPGRAAAIPASRPETSEQLGSSL